MGLGKKRSKLGEWLDQQGKSQEWLTRESGLGRNTISYLCAANNRLPSANTMKKIMIVIRSVDPDAQAVDFWNI